MREKARERKNKRKKIPKEISQDILKRVFENVFKAICIMIYFIIINFANKSANKELIIMELKIFASAFFVFGIVILEIAYKKDKGNIYIAAIELLVMAFHSLSIMHVITFYKYNFFIYLVASSYVFAIYFVFKSIFIYTKGRKQYLDGLSDISEIVKKDGPAIKEAKKRNVEKETNIEKTKKSAKKEENKND